MELIPYLFIIGYLLIGVFVASIESTIGYNNDFSFLVMTLWPVVICILIVAVIFYIPFKLGKFIGELISELFRR